MLQFKTVPVKIENSPIQSELKTPNKEINMTHKTLKIEGMTCGHCSARVEKALNALDGVEAKVDLAAKTAQLNLTSVISDEIIKKAVTDAGYEVL